MKNIMSITVSKKEAKRMIDEAPCEKITIFYVNRSTHVHQETRKADKSEGKELLNIAREVFYNDMEMFGMLSLNGELKNEEDILRNIAFPKRE